jgi:hypothetical protein
MRVLKLTILFLGLLILLSPPLLGNAALFGFNTITSGNADDVNIGESQFFVEVLELNSGQISFDFFNLGTEACAAARIYFDYGYDIPFTGASIVNSEGVSFVVGSKPPKLPGGKRIGFTTDFSAGAEAPPPKNGINPGESLRIIFYLADDWDFDRVVEALLSGDLRLGIHVVAFHSGGGESFINKKQIVPLPPTILLFATGFLGLLGYRLRFRFSSSRT